MTDLNYLSTIALGKINSFEGKKAAGITPVSFPGEDSDKTEAIDTLGIIAYFNISGTFTGKFEDIQGQIYDLRAIADGEQYAVLPLRAAHVNVKNNGNRTIGNLGTTTTGTTGTTLKDSSANFATRHIVVGDYVKNLITGEVTTVATVVSDTELTLTADINLASGFAYAVTATMYVKVLSFDHRWEPPGATICTYSLSVIQSI